MKTENPIILNTGGIGAVSIDMTHTNCVELVQSASI